MGEIILKGYVCERCGHKWAPRENMVARPRVCPKCKSAYWDSPRKLNVAKRQLPNLDFKEKRKLR